MGDELGPGSDTGGPPRREAAIPAVSELRFRACASEDGRDSECGDEGASSCSLGEFLREPLALAVLLALLAIAVFGGMFVVPLYAFITTRVAPAIAARTIAANNIVSSGAMVVGSLAAWLLSALGVSVIEQLLLAAAMCLISAWLAYRLYNVERAGDLAMTILEAPPTEAEVEQVR